MYSFGTYPYCRKASFKKSDKQMNILIGKWTDIKICRMVKTFVPEPGRLYQIPFFCAYFHLPGILRFLDQIYIVFGSIGRSLQFNPLEFDKEAITDSIGVPSIGGKFWILILESWAYGPYLFHFKKLFGIFSSPFHTAYLHMDAIVLDCEEPSKFQI